MSRAIFSTILLFILIPAFSLANDNCEFKYTKKSFVYKNISITDGYTQYANLTGEQGEKLDQVVDITFTEIENIDNLQINHVNKKGKWVKLKDHIERSILTNSFYQGIRAKSFKFPGTETPYEFNYSYELSNSDYMFLSDLPLNSYECTDEMEHVIYLPKGYNLKYKLSGDSTTLHSYKVETKKEDGFTVYTFSSSIKDKLEWNETAAGYKDLYIMPVYRICILPPGEDDGYAQFNKYYNELMKPQSTLNADAIEELESWTEGIEDKEKIIECIFDSVKKKISYIDFENGIGAIQPRNVNDILKKKQGDCKDMSNLICQALKLNGVNAYMAISSTIYHDYEFDFPCIASADHCVAVAEINDKKIYLDATEDYGSYGHPSQQIQNKNVFIVNNSGGELVKVPLVNNKENLALLTVNLNKNKEVLEGDFTYELSGMSKIEILTFLKQNSKSDIEYSITYYLESKFNNLQLSEITFEEKNEKLVIYGKANSKNAFLTVGEATYLSQNILMDPHDYKMKLDEKENIFFNQALNNQFIYNIILDRAIKLRPVDEVALDQNDLHFKYSIQQPSDSHLKINYSFQSNTNQIKISDIEVYNKLNDNISKTFKKKIKYEPLGIKK